MALSERFLSVERAIHGHRAAVGALDSEVAATDPVIGKLFDPARHGVSQSKRELVRCVGGRGIKMLNDRQGKLVCGAGSQPLVLHGYAEPCPAGRFEDRFGEIGGFGGESFHATIVERKENDSEEAAKSARLRAAPNIFFEKLQSPGSLAGVGQTRNREATTGHQAQKVLLISNQ